MSDIYGLTHAGDWVGVAVDEAGHLICVPLADHLEHEGRNFVASYLWPALGVGASGLFAFINDGNVDVRVAFNVTASGLATVTLWEGMSFTGGTVVTVTPMNRLTTRASGCRAYHSMVPTSWGTELRRDWASGAATGTGWCRAGTSPVASPAGIGILCATGQYDTSYYLCFRHGCRCH